MKGFKTFLERNYKKEYDNYHSSPEQKKRRAGRNKARKSLKDNKGIVGKDVHHKDNNPLNNDKSNLSVVTQKYNRTEPRLRDEEREPQDKDIKDKEGTQPSKYFKGLKKTTKNKRDAHFKKGAEKSDSDSSAYKDAPGDKKARKKPMPKSKYTKSYKDMYDEVTNYTEGALEDKAKKSGISVGTLKKVYNRGMAAWKTGHRPGTTPQQWGFARVNAFIVKKKKGGLNHDTDLAHIVHPDDDLMNEARAFHDFGANSPAANNKIRDISNKAKDEKDALNKIIDFAKGSSTASKKFAQAIGSGKFTDWSPDKDIEQNIKDFIQQRDRVKKLGPRANDPDQNLQVQLKGAEDLRTGSNVKLDDGKAIKVTQANAKIINMALDKVKPQTRVQVIKLLGKNKQSFMKTLSAIKRSVV
jgi:hypothetical protein